MLTYNDIKNLNWKKFKNMIPAIAQHYISGEILMFGYMNQSACIHTLENKLFTLYSRKKKRLWVKGETSKNFLHVKKLTTDCDRDVILVHVKPVGNTCHLNRFSCFESSKPVYSFLLQLENIIKLRKKNTTDKSYVSNLLSLGRHRIAQKIGEESVEVIIAFLEKNSINVINESSDLLFHLLVLLQSIDIDFKLIIKNLKCRTNK
ncbi:Histidine biosynthesis bifunctional protein HisIE [Buchnera aphidicola (Cinara pseudotaxifoliae)]|uniref:Histidine biosynthesis bifunctional protein HisIE n=1 Tax=Buchnera aphidicola (Cinara pseudotaxifoliae) TaxID=655384 RepID=A0A451DGD0_9GAMM|nr:bifunctional phosphoribosyl-AMP cyclohydrolase/phosphoribosyl-ATP diphosphatase HisIE [Buchnera aphidicola]VFP85676.1 Histidine biosynthesis bifunctional protein HisIE [Buchnera aphidicola (Cinara pseudotaxifoliae)]